MANAARKPLSKSAIRAIAIRRSVARRAANDVVANDNQRAPRREMPAGLLADCVAAGGFDQNARYA